MIRRFFSLLAILLLASSANAQFIVQEAFPNLSFARPVDLQASPDGTDRLFVLEQDRAVIRVFDNYSAVNDTSTFLNLSDRVRISGNEEGLLGMAFHPNYANNGYFYVYYSAPNPRRSVISRFSVSAGDPDVADKGSEHIIIEVGQPFSNHNGGQIAFGSDGYLYIALGDGGSAGDPFDHSEDPKTLLGSILRLDVDNTDEGLNYGIPEDNPFFNDNTGIKKEIYAYGLRNPWRFSFDPETGWLWTGDVGQDDLEEIDVIKEGGGHYGWNVMEGNLCYEPSMGCDGTGLEPPVWVYTRDLGVSVTGGFVYRGTRVPALTGRYIVGDYATGQLWAVDYDGENPATAEPLLRASFQIPAFGIDENQELYILGFNGKIYQLVDSRTISIESPAALEVAHLGANFPNPFAKETTLNYSLEALANVDLAIYDVLGRRIRTLFNGTLPAGRHTANWHGETDDHVQAPAGVYFCRLTVDDSSAQTRTLLKTN